MSGLGHSTKFAFTPLRTEPPRFGRRSPLRIGFDEPTAVEACGEFRPKVRGHRPLPCRDSGRAGGAASQQNPFNHWPQLAFELRDARIKVNSADPGFTATDLNQHRGYQTVEQGASEAVRLALLPADGPTGGFFSTAGRDPW
jgi:hypothetical protein